jgi:hypothetical protein
MKEGGQPWARNRGSGRETRSRLLGEMNGTEMEVEARAGVETENGRLKPDGVNRWKTTPPP